MNSNPKTLLAQGNCDPCVAGNNFAMEVINSQLLTKILLALNPSAVTDPKTLLAQGNCLMCFAANPFMLLVIQSVLLDSINAALGGGAGPTSLTQVYQDHTGSPPVDPTKPAISFPTGGGGISEWDVASQKWI